MNSLLRSKYNSLRLVFGEFKNKTLLCKRYFSLRSPPPLPLPQPPSKHWLFWKFYADPHAEMETWVNKPAAFQFRENRCGIGSHGWPGLEYVAFWSVLWFTHNQIQPFIIIGSLIHISSSWSGPRRVPVVTSTIFKYRTLPTSVDDFWEALVSNLGLRARSYSHCCVSG